MGSGVLVGVGVGGTGVKVAVASAAAISAVVAAEGVVGGAVGVNCSAG